MTIIYAAKDKRKQVYKMLDIDGPHVFASPSDQAVDHSATRVVIVGNHPSIADRYKGLAKIEFIDLDEPEDEED